MALVVEDGTGKADAESYNSLSEVTTTLTKTGEETAWLALASDTIREQVARKVTRAMDTEHRFRGTKKKQEQALEWPKVDAFDDDGWPYPDDSLPARLKQAHAVLCAAASVPGADLQPDQTEPGAIESESISVGKISISTTYAGGKDQEVYYRKAESLLAELVEPAGILERA